MKAFEHHTPPANTYARRGRASAIHPQARDGLREFLECKPWAYQTEMMDYLLDDFGLSVMQYTVSRTLKQMKITQKSLRKIADARDPEIRTAYFENIAVYQHDQLVYLDESAANQRTTHRKRGWCALGIAPHVRLPFKRKKRWTILPAYCSDGILCYMIYHGSFDAGLFEAFVKYHVLPHCNPFPSPKSVLIMDNASIHKSQRLKDLCEQHGVIIQYLPPYSPDLNPIESYFSKLKAWMKKHWELAKGIEGQEFEDFLHLAMSCNNGKVSAPGHFRRSHIRVQLTTH